MPQLLVKMHEQGPPMLHFETKEKALLNKKITHKKLPFVTKTLRHIYFILL